MVSDAAVAVAQSDVVVVVLALLNVLQVVLLAWIADRGRRVRQTDPRGDL